MLPWACLAFFGAYWAYSGRNAAPTDPRLTFDRLSRGFRTAEEIASAFKVADSALLMASYAIFFCEFLEEHGFASVELLKKASEEEKRKGKPINVHRLDALPAVAAAHLLEIAKLPETRNFLSQYILKALKDPRREVQEIILQNLVTSVAPNFDSLHHFSIEADVIARIVEILQQACDNEKLMSPALIGTEFLLNAHASLVYRGANDKLLQPYSRAIRFAEEFNQPHMRHIPELIRLHRASFKASPNHVDSLPPQSSEALIGWRQLHPHREYLSILAFNRARLTYTIFQTASGKVVTDDIMTQEQAKAALPKIVAFFKAFDLDLLLRGSGVLNLAFHSEPKFANFLRVDFPELLERPDKFDIDINRDRIAPEMIALKDHVPFARYGKKSVFTKVIKEGSGNARKAIQLGQERGFSRLDDVNVSALLTPILGEEVNRITKEEKEKAREEILTREGAVKEGNYKGLDEQQATIGDLDIERL